MKPAFWYVLDENHEPVKATVKEWTDFITSDESLLIQQELSGYWISTVFSGFSDHLKKPVNIFETAVFDKSGECIFKAKFSEYKWAPNYHRLGVGAALEHAGRLGA